MGNARKEGEDLAPLVHVSEQKQKVGYVPKGFTTAIGRGKEFDLIVNGPSKAQRNEGSMFRAFMGLGPKEVEDEQSRGVQKVTYLTGTTNNAMNDEEEWRHNAPRQDTQRHFTIKNVRHFSPVGAHKDEAANEREAYSAFVDNKDGSVQPQGHRNSVCRNSEKGTGISWFPLLIVEDGIKMNLRLEEREVASSNCREGAMLEEEKDDETSLVEKSAESSTSCEIESKHLGTGRLVRDEEETRISSAVIPM